MNAPQPMSPRSRLQTLLAIPESQRTDAQWDEIHELEIKLSSANRDQPPEQGARRNTPATTTRPPRPSGGAQGRKPFQKVHHKRRSQGFASSIPWIGEVTTPRFAMVRLHGRNANTLDEKGLSSSGDWFNYLYSAAELTGLAEKIRPIAAIAQRTHVYFNNNYEDYGIRNALDFGQVLGI